MNKRGAGNVEFILAFVMFVSFVVLALYFFNPVRDLTSIESSKNYVLGEIISNASVELDSYSIISSGSSSEKRVVNLNIAGEQGKNASVEDYNGSPIQSSWSGGNICFENSKGFAIAKFSEDIAGNNAATCGEDSGSQISSSIASKVISENRILKLNSSYYMDYSELKSRLGIPPNIDFSFILEFPNGIYKISAERNVVLSGAVYSETKIVEVLRTGGESQFGYLTVKVW